MTMTSPAGSFGSLLSLLLRHQVVMRKAWSDFSLRSCQGYEKLGFSALRLHIIILLTGPLLQGLHGKQEPLYYETVIPRNLVMFRELEQKSEKVSYILIIKGKRHILNLKQKKGLFVKNFPVYTQQKGKVVLDMPFIQDDCYYDGYSEGDTNSLVTISTCSGLNGILTLRGTVFGIKPIYASNKFEHLVYRIFLNSSGSCEVREEQEELLSNSHAQSRLETSVPTAMWSSHKYVEMFIVVDNKRFQLWNNNVTKTTQMVMDVHALVNRYMKELNVKVVLTGLEIWTENNLVQVPLNLQDMLQNFNQWRIWHLSQRVKHDVAHMITGQNLGKDQGYSFISGVCTEKMATSVEAFSHEDIIHLAALMAHELGHNLGMKHDHTACKCYGQDLCTMHEFITVDRGFSNCSFHYFYQLLHKHRGDCLFNKPELRSSFGKSYCGNKIVDHGEECDCGNALDCRKDHCCLPSCKLKRGSDCAYGSCCKNCKFLQASTLCRPSVDECDLPEYCNGTSKWCQADTYKQDGTPCKIQGYCYQGQCRSLKNQCVKIFGQGTRVAPENCYHYVNTKGDKFGNCGSESKGIFKVFRKCEAKDVKCGRLLCENIQRLPRVDEHHTLIQFSVEGTWCWGAESSKATSKGDEGDVQDGTPCGPQKICINQTCLDTSVLLHSDCNLEKCHGRGVCNNLKNCHCVYGYSPPTCESEGFGGSLDSGPAPRVPFDLNYGKMLKIFIWLLPIFLLFLIPSIFLLVYSNRKYKTNVRAKNSSE
ncbi:PREDICTED: disintegrin and metalloproteinase domain-containing protein 1a-like [Elephantulus edwardii]|uniref:disintegrin and metalloproteinase domain-containing protein 1a-like n=1 Tax=Elephantulus edwardii TaxID=28737 RepID=UPI0003F075AC|nr:PREDICTED: disintegrin and metalloproteinase domain-containing protein 1a-like [Elephantulus edwardii]